jgi:hypothetical protein
MPEKGTDTGRKMQGHDEKSEKNSKTILGITQLCLPPAEEGETTPKKAGGLAFFLTQPAKNRVFTF